MRQPLFWKRVAFVVKNMRVLIIEDDAETAAYVADGLRRSGHVADQASDGRDGLITAAGGDYDVIVVDRMLPGIDGLAIVKMIRSAGIKSAVLFLTARGGIDDKVEGLEAGGDDYLTKPFAFSELLARLNALARRPPFAPIETVLRVADLEMDLIAHRVKRNGTDIDLQPREFRLLEYLMRNAGRVVTRTMLLEGVWEFHFDPRRKLLKPTSAGSAPRSARPANNSSFTQFGEWGMSFGLPLRLMRTASFGLALSLRNPPRRVGGSFGVHRLLGSAGIDRPTDRRTHRCGSRNPEGGASI